MQVNEQVPKQTNDQPQGKARGFAPGVSGNPRGKALMQDRARADQAAAAAEAESIARDLGRVPTALEKVLIAEIAALSVKAKRLRAEGRPCDDVVRLLSR